MDTPDFEHGRVYFKQFGAERVNQTSTISNMQTRVDASATDDFRKQWEKFLMMRMFFFFSKFYLIDRNLMDLSHVWPIVFEVISRAWRETVVTKTLF